MSIPYDKFKVPFFDIKVGDSTGQRMVSLPHHILRLVSKIDILETLEEGQFNTITIDFIEGSREPSSVNANLGTKGLYRIPNESGKIDMNISGSITNRPGAITDLRFSGNSGITFLTADEAKKGRVSDTSQKNVNEKYVTRKHKAENSKPRLLFQERNQVHITWGYKGDNSSLRSIRGYIMLVQTHFSNKAPTTTRIICHDTRAALDQIATTKGISFGTAIRTGTNGSLITFKNGELSSTIKEICNKSGMACIVSKNLPSDVKDADYQKMWLAGESFNQFMTRLAEKHNAYYTVYPNHKTGKDTLAFIKKSDMEAKILNVPRQFLSWKNPGSILTDINISVDFSGLGGNAQNGMSESGELIGTNTSFTTSRQFTGVNKKSEEVINIDPTSTNPVKGAKGVAEGIANGEYTNGTVDYNPENNSKNLSETAGTEADKSFRTIKLDFNSIGHSKITPGVVSIQNIGVRYSGKYRILTVNHTIDAKSGYTCKANAISFAVNAGGVLNPEAPKTKDKEEEEVTQFASVTREGTKKDIDVEVANTYFKNLGVV